MYTKAGQFDLPIRGLFQLQSCHFFLLIMKIINVVKIKQVPIMFMDGKNIETLRQNNATIL